MRNHGNWPKVSSEPRNSGADECPLLLTRVGMWRGSTDEPWCSKEPFFTGMNPKRGEMLRLVIGGGIPHLI